MAFIEPGTKFHISYGNDHEIEVVALAGRKQKQLAKLIVTLQKAEAENKVLEAFDACEEALAICLGEEKATELFDTCVDAELAIEIASKTLSKQVLSEDERKKSESPR